MLGRLIATQIVLGRNSLAKVSTTLKSRLPEVQSKNVSTGAEDFWYKSRKVVEEFPITELGKS